MELFSLTLDASLRLLTEYGYVFLFLVAIIEGPIITVLGAFLASQLLLNVFAVFFIVVAADLVGDVIYYGIGRGAAHHPRWYRLLGVAPEQLDAFCASFKNHLGKALITAKYTQTGFIVLPAAGAARMPLGAFALYNLLAAIPRSFLLVIIGYFFGYAYESIDAGIRLYSLIAAGVLIFAGSVYYVVRRRTQRRTPSV